MSNKELIRLRDELIDKAKKEIGSGPPQGKRLSMVEMMAQSKTYGHNNCQGECWWHSNQ